MIRGLSMYDISHLLRHNFYYLSTRNAVIERLFQRGVPERMRGWACVGLMLGQPRRRWHNIKPTKSMSLVSNNDRQRAAAPSSNRGERGGGGGAAPHSPDRRVLTPHPGTHPPPPPLTWSVNLNSCHPRLAVGHVGYRSTLGLAPYLSRPSLGSVQCDFLVNIRGGISGTPIPIHSLREFSAPHRTMWNSSAIWCRDDINDGATVKEITDIIQQLQPIYYSMIDATITQLRLSANS